MTINPAYIESQEKSLRNQCLLLHLGCNLSLIAGLIVSTLPSFLTNNQIIRISCLTGGFILGCNIVLVSSQLQVVTRRSKALEKAVQENFGLDLVTKQIMIEGDLKSRLLPQPVPEYTPDNQYTPDNNQSLEIPESDDSNESYIEISEPQYNDVLMALESGKSDTYIIQDVLGKKGRKYQEGKVILTQIKQEQLQDEI
jgi:hypothetical protein